MALRNSDPQAVEAEVAALGDLDLAAIRERWRVLFGNPPPKSLRHAFLVKACAYGIRTRAFGGLSKATKRRLREIADATRMGKPTPAAPVRTRAGTRLIRAWGGKTHVVTVVAAGFEYEGQTFKSLSAIAKAITGTNWNGKTFFGVKKPTAGRTPTNTDAAASAAYAGTRRPTARGGSLAPNETQKSDSGRHNGTASSKDDSNPFPPTVSSTVPEPDAGRPDAELEDIRDV